MGKRKLITGIVTGAALGGVVSLLNKDTREYAKKGFGKVKDNVSNYAGNPSEAIEQIKHTVEKVSSFVEDNKEGAFNTLEQVESTVNKFLK